MTMKTEDKFIELLDMLSFKEHTAEHVESLTTEQLHEIIADAYQRIGILSCDLATSPEEIPPPRTKEDNILAIQRRLRSRFAEHATSDDDQWWLDVAETLYDAAHRKD